MSARERSGRSQRPLLYPVLLLCLIGLGAMPAGTRAQEDVARTHDIPSGPLAPALERFARAAGITLSFDPALVEGRSTSGIEGELTVEEGLRQLLAGTGLDFRLGADGTVTLVAQDEDNRLERISVTAARGPEGVQLSSVPGSVTVIDRETIERQSATSPGIDDLLSRNVPGFAASNHARTNFGESLRGRDYLVMIDGVPISTPLRNVSRDLSTIDLSAVERIEVVRGSVATYGNGATGGLINMITRDGRGEPRRWTRIRGGGSGTHPDSSGSLRLEQGFSGTRGDTRYTVTGGVERNAGLFDADGDRIPPNPFSNQGGSRADSTTLNLQTRIDHALDDEREVGLRVNLFDSEQDTDFAGDFTTGSPPTSEKAAAVRRGSPRENEIDVGTENRVFAATYRDRRLWGQDFQARAYYEELEAVFAWFDYPAFPASYPGATEGGNSILESEKLGVRGEFSSRVGATGVTWGVDVNRDETVQRITNGQISTPEMVQDTVAPFVQLERELGERWTLRGGTRYERARVDVDDFTTVSIAPSTVEGGTLDYGEAVFNIGAVYRIDRTWDAFASFSQGFSLAEIGRELRSTSASSAEELDPEAQVVDNYEVGLRATGLRWDASVALFENRSDNGVTFDNDLNVVKQKERVYGLEADLNVDVGERWRTGGTLTLIEGRFDSDGDGDIDEYLDGTRISPPKLTVYGQYRANGWTHRADLLYVGSRDRFDEATAGFGQSEVESYTTVDWTSTRPMGDGVLQLAASNLFNEQYIPALGQAYNFSGVGYVAAPGLELSATYEWQW